MSVRTVVWTDLESKPHRWGRSWPRKDKRSYGNDPPCWGEADREPDAHTCRAGTATLHGSALKRRPRAGQETGGPGRKRTAQSPLGCVPTLLAGCGTAPRRASPINASDPPSQSLTRGSLRLVSWCLSFPYAGHLCFREGLIAESGCDRARRHLRIRFGNKAIPLPETLSGVIVLSGHLIRSSGWTYWRKIPRATLASRDDRQRFPQASHGDDCECLKS